MSEDDELIIIKDKSKDQKIQERDEKRKKISKGYYDIPEEEMQEIIARVKEGSEKDLEYLFQMFNNFLEKYVNMLSNNYYDLRDYDIKCFINLYIGDKTLNQKIKSNSLNLKSYKKVTDTLKGIFYMIQRYNNENDIRATVQMTFLECVMKYKRKGSIPFSGYLYRYFFYILKRNVDELLIDQNGLNSFPLVTDDAVSSSYVDSIDGSNPGMIPEGTMPLSQSAEDVAVFGSLQNIDERWVLGETAEFPFSELSIQERQLIKWRYVDGLRPNKIAEKTSDHPNTSRQHIKIVVNKIRALLEEDINLH